MHVTKSANCKNEEAQGNTTKLGAWSPILMLELFMLQGHNLCP